MNVLAVVAIVLLVLTAATTVAALLLLRSLHRANRVVRSQPTLAPLSWLVSLGAPPRLHRRLRRAVDSVEFASGSLAPAALAIGDVAQELREHAIAVDQWLVGAYRLPPVQRRHRLHELVAEVRTIEAAAGRLHQLSWDWRRQVDLAAGQTAPTALDLHERLDAVEAALSELSPAAGAPAPAPGVAASAAPAPVPLPRQAAPASFPAPSERTA